MKNAKKPELLSPAGSLEKLKHAVVYGADAVYVGGQDLSLRAAADNLSVSEIEEGTSFSHKRGVKVYAAINIFAHNRHFEDLTTYIRELADIGVDAVIVTDPGIIKVIKESTPKLPIFMSVQANVTNFQAARFWAKSGAKRVTLARELTLSEVRKIVAAIDIETEVFIHGAVCISYSGRCLLSKYLSDRDANQGNCAHSCRWKYFLMEEKRPNELYPIEEDDQGTYILSSKDLCLLKVLPDLISTGVTSLKIEGRMKSLHYVSVVTRVYREAIDSYWANPDAFELDLQWDEELAKVSHRTYTKGFIAEEEEKESASTYLSNADFVGVVKDWDAENNAALVGVRNRICEGEMLEAYMPSGRSQTVLVKDLRRLEDGVQLDSAHANYNVYISSSPLPEFSILRRPTR